MDYLQTVVDYVEGRVPFEQFYALILADDGFANWINQHAPSVWGCTERPSEANGHQFTFVPYEVRSKLKNMEWAYPVDSIDYQYELESAMEVLLEDSFPEVVFHADPTLAELFDLKLRACPSYIDGPEVWKSGILDRILRECPEEWSVTRKAKHIRARILEEFHIEGRKYPHWIQNPDWPVHNGKPMKYVSTSVKRRHEWLQHHFVDVDTGEERIVDDAD